METHRCDLHQQYHVYQHLDIANDLVEMVKAEEPQVKEWWLVEELTLRYIEQGSFFCCFPLAVTKEIEDSYAGMVKFSKSPIPKEILPEPIEGHITDFIVSRKNDDIFRKSDLIWRNITRGLSILELSCEGGKLCVRDLAIHANRKFFGLEEQLPICLQPLALSEKIVCMDKLDGDAAHFTFRLIDGSFYMIGGSKHVHLIVKDIGDIDKYKDPRFSDAKDIAKGIFNCLHRLDALKLNLLKRFLHSTKITVVCEILRPHNQHVVNNTSLMEGEEVELYFLMFCHSPEESGVESLTAFPPHIGMTIAKGFGLQTPCFSVCDSKDVEKKVEETRQKHASEGGVLYYLDGRGLTIAIEKVKSVWHLMLGALAGNFKFTKKVGDKMEARMSKIESGFKALQLKYDFSDEY